MLMMLLFIECAFLLFILALLALVLLLLASAQALQFHLPPGQEKCVIEDVRKNELMMGDFSVAHLQHRPSHIYVSVIGPIQNVLYENDDDIQGKYAFTTTETGEYTLCFRNIGPNPRDIVFSFKTGVNAKDYTTVAKKDNLKPLEVELKRLEDVTAKVHEDFLYIQEQDTAMRRTNESIRSRVLYFSLLSMLTIIGMTILQILYLRGYFQKKKMID